MSMWLRLSNGRDELVVNEDHITRLLNEGAVEIPDPRLQPESVVPPLEEKSGDADSSDDKEITEQLPAQKRQLAKRVSKPAKE